MEKTGRNLLLLACLLVACHSAEKRTAQLTGSNFYDYTTQKKLVCENGCVVSAHALASRIGVEILKHGGNAIDAAIAVQLALAVVYPAAGNIGGGGFMVARLADGRLLALDFREIAPIRSGKNMYLDSAGNVKEGESINGYLASGVPGTVAGLFAAAHYGKLPFQKLIQPAIDLAEKGIVLTAHEAGSLNSVRSDLEKYNTRPNVFDSKTWREGDTLVQIDLANTLKRIRDAGEKGFYDGKTAVLIEEEMKRGGGLIGSADLAAYKAKFRDPHVFDYKGYRIVGMPMPSSGGILLHQMMTMIEDRNIGSMGFETPASVQLMTEVERRAFADRAEYMGDLDFYKVPEKILVSNAYLRHRMEDYKPGIAGNSKLVRPGIALEKESKQTTHISIIDKEGNAVAVTTTLNNSYGCKTVVGGAGFFLNDEMDDFSAKPGVPNLYGALGGEANAIAPQKRMLSSMAPTIVLKKDSAGGVFTPFLIVGTPGGTTIPTSVFQTVVDILEFNMDAEDAVDKPKFHHQWLPDSLLIENGFPSSVIKALRKMGYHIKNVDAIGRTELIKCLPGGKFEAVADDRGDDDAEGF